VLCNGVATNNRLFTRLLVRARQTLGLASCG
jgi:hypothetical protein